MGIRGLFAFLRRERIRGAVKDYSVEEFAAEIKDYERKFNKKPKLLINLRAFNHYYEQNVKDCIFGGRLNSIKFDFENLLSKLKNAGAELIFISKSTEDFDVDSSNEEYQQGIDFVSKIQQLKRVDKLTNAYKKSRNYPWNELTIMVMTQSAKKFGVFRENACNLRNNSAGHALIANEEEVFGIIGLNTSYLFYDGLWRFFYPMSELDQYGHPTLIFKEYDKKRILNHFNFDMDQMQLFGVLAGRFTSTSENCGVLASYFSTTFRNMQYTDFHKVIDFVHQRARRDKFPLEDYAIKELLREIFGYDDSELMQDFKNSLKVGPVYADVDENLKEINAFLRNNPYAYMVEKFLNKYSFCIESFFLDITKNDMKSLKALTLSWLRRVCGILFKNSKESQNIKVTYRFDAEKYEDIEIIPDYPEFEIPPLMNLLQGDMNTDAKFKNLAFLINNIIDEDSLKKIPNDFIMHDIITKHLVKNNSMTEKEEQAITKTVKEPAAKYTIYPNEVNIRIFRSSAVYRKIYEVLLYSLFACGLEEFISDVKLDSVQYQYNFSELNK
ncbi:hypothetical protein PVAND_007074 [Polypedilum vanderplanki]|uniref:Uncharacterized protein n=1 Tax=Polypedilum vanderplanki TaxID=319348 RepID=A0A9J6C5A1_POLVA|nr:hypothetical protein PVAND_007074 [Polypedilum vanderplanki]